MAAAAILKITFLAITRPLLHAFALNLKQRLKMGFQGQIYRQNSHTAKIQDGGGRHFEINQMAITAIFEWICTKFELTQTPRMRSLYNF